jgi:hypothetical protein
VRGLFWSLLLREDFWYADAMNVARPFLAPLLIALLGAACDDLIAEPDAAASAEDPCRLPCPLGSAVACALDPSVTFPRLDAQLEQWTAEYCADAGTAGTTLAEGRCADGKRFVSASGIVAGSEYYYDARGRFVGLVSDSDVGWPGCSTLPAYWPTRPVCENRAVTRVVCGNAFWVDQQL